ncbi:MAG: hypothetical protein KVP17_001191 [Porospora cf. gigantea B]|uniref:uncharacterized protein n=1 Tax=Porospora cf. gigantea B TaxID=2853592 RepID=UPI003571E6B4|nr:MAG: hypothetical protein KVP17_001191 [Porospora cf. gigantea B]
MQYKRPRTHPATSARFPSDDPPELSVNEAQTSGPKTSRKRTAADREAEAKAPPYIHMLIVPPQVQFARPNSNTEDT